MDDRDQTARIGRAALSPLLLAVALGAALALGLAQPAPGAGPATLTVDPASRQGVVNGDLAGFGWHGHVPLERIAPLKPAVIRIDASLEEVSPRRGVVRLGPLLDQVAAVRAAGGEPLVILSYTPAWLGRPLALGRDPTRVAPSDLGAWEWLVHDVVEALATAPAPALRFEAWNEPDLPLFWQDTPTAWVDTVARSARAVAAVERETGLDLAFGGPATAVPDPLFLEPFLLRFRDPALPLDFVSWHYYGNYPFLGPDGTEFEGTELLQDVLGHRNPLTTPMIYGAQVKLMRALVELGFAGSQRELPSLLLDEWNLSAGGYDRRHDTHAGAAFAVATLIEMQRSGLDAAAYFRAGDRLEPGNGDHGILFADGRRKPAWWAFDLWRRLGPRRLALAGAQPSAGLFAIGSRGRKSRRVRVLIASFSALAPRANDVTVRVKGTRVERARVRRIDAAHRAAHVAERLPVTASAAQLELPPQAVALVSLRVGSRP